MNEHNDAAWPVLSFAERYRFSGPTQDVRPDGVVQASTVWELEPNACLGKNRVNIGGTVIVNEQGAQELNPIPSEMRVVN